MYAMSLELNKNHLVNSPSGRGKWDPTPLAAQKTLGASYPETLCGGLFEVLNPNSVSILPQHQFEWLR